MILDDLRQDFTYALRTLRKSPCLVAVAVLSLGLGIGSNVAIFAAVDVFMLRPLPFDGEDRLLDLVAQNADNSPDNLARDIFKAVEAFDKLPTQDDDQTLVIIDFDNVSGGF